jgi:hypothetical protein
VLGSHTAGELEAHGQEGHTIAQLATEAAPTTAADGGGANAGQPGHKGGKGAPGSGGSGNGGSGNGGTGSGGSSSGGGVSGAESLTAPDGSSGLSEVLGHATGSSSGEMGVFLPLVLLAVPLLALLYAWRRRHPDRAAS